MKKTYIFKFEDNENQIIEELKKIYNVKTSSKLFIHILNQEKRRHGL